MPIIIFSFLIIYIFLFFSQGDTRNPLAISDFLKPVTISVEVISLVKHQRCYQSFTIKPLNQHYYFRASWFSCQAWSIHVGDILKTTIRLKPLHAMNNPGGFDSVQWAQENNIVAQATIKSAEKIDTTHGLMVDLQKLREHLAALTHDHLAQFGANQEVIAVVESLTLGIRQNLSWQVLQDFNLSGTRHLLAISGSHVAMVALITYVFFFGVIRLVIILRPTLNAHVLALALSVLFIVFYVSISGEQLPTLRALWMALLALVAIFLNRYSSLMYRIFIAAIIVLLLKPQAIYSPSFYLTFCAVFLIAYHLAWSNGLNKWKNYLRLNFLLLMGLLPISLYFFSQYSLVTFVTNLMAIPWIGFIILPLSILLQWLSYFGCQCYFLWHGLAWMTQKFLQMLHFFSNITLHIPGMFITGHLPLSMAMLLFFLLLLVFLPRGVPGRLVSSIALLSIFFWQVNPPLAQAELIFLNVGQGLSILVKTRHHLLVYDTGPKFFSGGDVAQSTLLPYFYYRGWKSIDILMVSHGDADHAGGVETLRKNLPIKSIITSAIHKIPQSILCQRGQHWRWDNIDFSVIYPDAAHQGKNNNSSCVLKISVGTQSALLTGDIEKSAERYLTKVFPQDLHATIISVPHHGSKTSSSENFLVAIHPQYAIFSYGFLNKFHFPSPVVMQRYGEKSIIPLITESGPVVAELSLYGLDIHS